MKKLSTLLICFLIMLTCVFTGCATFSINKVKYYNEVLAKVGDEKITRFEVLSAYNSYGKSYYQQQLGKSEKEAIESTLDLLIDRELIYQSAKKDATYKPTASQVNSVIESMFTSLDSQMDSYITKALNMLDIEEVQTADDTTSETVYLYKDYVYENSRRATLESKTTYYTTADKTTISSTPTEFFNIEYSIKYILPEEEPYKPVISETYLQDFEKDGIIDVIREEYLNRLETRLNEDYSENGKAIKNKVIQLLVNDLLDYEYYLRDDNGKAYNKIEKDLINRYFERNFNSQIESQYLENVRTHYLENETLSVTAIMDKFNDNMVSSYSQYENRPSNYKTKMTGIGTDGDTVLYHPTLNDGTEFGYFIHTLLSFSDEQKTAIKNLDADDIYYADDYAEIVSKTEVDYRDNEGKVAGKAKLADIVEEYQAITTIPDYETKMKTFIQFMFKYTGDTATLSAGMPYVVGTNGNSSMVEAFTNEAVSLMETETLGAMSNVDMNNIDSFCITEYGIHFIFYVNEVNAYDFPYAEKNSVTILDLYNKEINPLTGETYFDMLFDQVYPAGSGEEVYTSNTGYSEFEENLISERKAEIKVIKYRTKINGTKTSF